MSMTANNEHFTLWSYKDSMIRKKLAYTEALLGLVQSWLDNTHDMDGDASFDGLAHAKRIRRIAARIEDTFEEAAIAQMCRQLLAAGGEQVTVISPLAISQEELAAELGVDVVALQVPDIPTEIGVE